MKFLQEIDITVTVNGSPLTATVPPEESLLDFLRNRGASTDVKCGCAKGDCGTCTVVFQGKVVKSCLVPAFQADGGEVWTLAGLAEDSTMQALQESFAVHGAVQCGFCTPGMLVTSRDLIQKNPDPSREEIKQALSGNLCRCTGYVKIVNAVAAVAASRKGGR